MDYNSSNFKRDTADFFSKNLFTPALDKIDRFENVINSSNPYLDRYRASFAQSTGSDQSKSILSLFLSSYLQSSLTTAFAESIMKYLIQYFEAERFKKQGIVKIFSKKEDLEYICKLKTGPNNINSSTPINDIARLNDAQNLWGITNHSIGFIFPHSPQVGEEILGRAKDKYIKASKKIWIGKDFWWQITGEEFAYKTILDAVNEGAEKSIDKFKDDASNGKELYNFLVEKSKESININFYNISRNY